MQSLFIGDVFLLPASYAHGNSAYCDVTTSTHLDGANYIYDTEVHSMKIYRHNFLLIKCAACMGKFRVMSDVLL
jgi:hypothetical protein